METQEDRNTQEPETTDNVLFHQALGGDQEAPVKAEFYKSTS